MLSNISIDNSSNMSIWSLVASSDAASKLILLLLLIASVISWAIIIKKYFLFKMMKKRMEDFKKSYTVQTYSVESMYDFAKQKNDNPLPKILISAVNEASKVDFEDIGNNASLIDSAKFRIFSAMSIEISNQNQKLEKNLGILATISSSSPFVGLLGTVWGIMHSFQSIAISKNTSLAVVAPGIAEALFATAVGLFVAIPSGMFFNLLTMKNEEMMATMENFAKTVSLTLSRSMDHSQL